MQTDAGRTLDGKGGAMATATSGALDTAATTGRDHRDGARHGWPAGTVIGCGVAGRPSGAPRLVTERPPPREVLAVGRVQPAPTAQRWPISRGLRATRPGSTRSCWTRAPAPRTTTTRADIPNGSRRGPGNRPPFGVLWTTTND